MPEYVHGSRTMWEQNLNGHVALEFDQKKKPYAMQLIKSAEDAAPEIKEYQVTEQGKVESRWWMEDMDAPFVNVMPVAYHPRRWCLLLWLDGSARLAHAGC